MIAFLSDLTAPPSAAAALSTQTGFGETPNGGAGEGRPPLDFAGLLDAALPEAGITLPRPDAQPAAAEPGAVRRLAFPLAGPAPGRAAVGAVGHARLPGTILPESGTDLPLPILVPEPDARAAATVLPAGGEAAGTITVDADEPGDVSLPEVVALPARGEAIKAISAERELSDDNPLPEAAVLALLPVAAAVTAHTPAPAPVSAQTVGAGEAARPPAPGTVLPGAGEARATLRPIPMPPRTDVPQNAAPAVPTDDTKETTRLSAPTLPPDGTSEAARPLAPASPAPPAPPPTAPVAAQPVQPHAPAQLAAAPEPRGPAPSQESTIAQVGAIRAALHNVRPEMTLRHGEFGFVSLRLEATAAAPQDWRAVLASRDPGFVPAVQAALAERALAASADAISSGMASGAGTGAQAGGHPGAGSPSEQRYGISQGGGQGSSSPYPGHSGQRDEGALPNQRHPQDGRADERAGSVAGARESEPPDRHRRGLFA